MKLGYPRSVGSSTYIMQGLTPDKLKKMLMEVYFKPSRHVDIIKQLMKTTQHITSTFVAWQPTYLRYFMLCLHNSLISPVLIVKWAVPSSAT